ncbi:MAG: MmcQ/YjbR family DNA-binding protein, partial [Pseudomonadales bacterium]|nr:MmcQ/YjbR family DNA-binding protein [Pseudomonadales bacterium]
MPDIHEVIRKICLAFPEAEEVTSHGSPDFRVRGKSYATFTVNHHGDGKLALLLNTSRETQQMYVDAAPKIFFVPPYVGPKGWVGIDLAQGMRWERVAELAHDAYVRVAPAALGKEAVPLKKVPKPDTVDIRK